MNISHDILLYADDGTEKVNIVEAGVQQSLDELNLQNSYKIKTVTADDIISANCFSTAKLLIMPGGRDLSYVRKLKGQGNQRIKEFVRCGGRYLGLCAGAYYASDRIEFEKGSEMEVCGDRELKFFNGLAIGTVFPGFLYNDTSGARVTPIQLHKEVANDVGINSCCVYYNGGCHFIKEAEDQHNTTEVIARYGDTASDKTASQNELPLCIIRCTVGEGVAILSGVHPELSAKYLDLSDYDEEFLDCLRRSEDDRAAFFRKLLSILLL